MKRKKFIISYFILTFFLFTKCSNNLEDYKWDLNLYFEEIMKDSLQVTYNNISLHPLSRDKENKSHYFFSYKDSIFINLELNPDYSYNIKRYQIVEYLYLKNKDGTLDSMDQISTVEDIDDDIKWKLDEMINKFKKWRLRAIGNMANKEGNFYIGFLMKNIKSNTLPFDKEIYSWINDSTKGNFVYSPYRSIDSNKYTVVRQLTNDWFFTVNKPLE